MRLYQNTQVLQKMGLQHKQDRHLCWTIFTCPVIENQHEEDDELLKPRKLPNPILASHQHRALHQELIFCHRRGVLPRKKPELLCVLEHKQREKDKQKELTLSPPSDFEVKLRTRQQRIQMYELEAAKRSESLKNIPEFILVRQTLRHVSSSVK